MSHLEALKYIAQKAKNKDRLFDPSVLNDEIASKTDWKSISGTSTNFNSRKLKLESSFKLIYSPSIQTYIVVFFIGIFVAFIPTVVTLLLIGKLVKVTLFGFVLIYVSFIIACLFLTRYIFKPRVFDKYEGWYYVGQNFCEKNKRCRLDSILAIQLVSHWVWSNNTDRKSHYCQMNLVLNDTTRISILTIRSLSTVRRDAEIIARFLNIPVWDGI